MRHLACDLSEIFHKNSRVYIGFSGGKDSTALVELCEPWRDRATLISVDTGYIFPHMLSHINSYGSRFRIEWVMSDQQRHWGRHGLPSRIVPTANVDINGYGVHDNPKMQAWQLCCASVINEPLQAFMRDKKGVLLHGQRLSEIQPGYHPSKVVFEQGADAGGYKIYAPLKDWSEDDVLSFLRERDVSLPVQYKYGTGDFSLDCWNCPAMLSRRRVDFMRDHYPRELNIASGYLMETYSAVRLAADDVSDVLEAVRAD